MSLSESSETASLPMAVPAAAARAPEPSGGSGTLVLVGNPNVGKSVLFGLLTGHYVTVSNYPGTTVEVTRGTATLGGRAWQVMDTPGTNNLMPMSEDERATRDILLAERGCTCLQVCDAKNLRRGLLLTAQLAEAGVRQVLALNMADEAAGRGFTIDEGRLAHALGVPVLATVAVDRVGVTGVIDSLGEARASTFLPTYDEAIEAAIAELEPSLPDDGAGLGRRALALMALVGDTSLSSFLAERLEPEARAAVDAIGRRLAGRYREPLFSVIARQRLAAVDRLHDRVVSRRAGTTRSVIGRKLALWSTHRVWGVPILAIVLGVCYLFVGVLGAKLAVDFLESSLFYDHVIPWVDAAVRWLVPAGATQEFLVGPAGVPFREHHGFLIGKYGIVSMGLSYGVAIILPIVTTFFFAFATLEDSGYLPRLAVMVNRPFTKMGLNGKAVLPMVLGLGCDTMATMTTRILETKKERILATLLLALAVPCSAQLAVILAMLAGVQLKAAVWFGVTILLVLFLVGWLAAKVLPGRGSDFVLELPPLRMPRPHNLLVKTVARVGWYLREALPLFILGTLILYTLDRVGGISVLERASAPVVENALGLPREAASAFILGFLRRDYAAAGLFAHYQPFMRAGSMTRIMEIQVVTALVTITLFLPCIANLFMIIKERGAKTAAAIMAFIVPFSVGVGALVNVLMRWWY
jgi:ferrous iron transport protein B